MRIEGYTYAKWTDVWMIEYLRQATVYLLAATLLVGRAKNKVLSLDPHQRQNLKGLAIENYNF
jgi:hypothetical protein